MSEFFWQRLHAARAYHIKGVHPLFRDYLLRALGDQEKPIAEIGAGTGRNLQYARQILGRGVELVATDLSLAAVETMRRQGIEAYLADMRDISCLPTGWAQVLISWRVLHHLDEGGRIDGM